MQASFVRILLAIYVTFTWPFVKVFAKIIADKHSLQFSYCIGSLVNFENWILQHLVVLHTRHPDKKIEKKSEFAEFVIECDQTF